jgi:hypothetical protein
MLTDDDLQEKPIVYPCKLNSIRMENFEWHI